MNALFGREARLVIAPPAASFGALGANAVEITGLRIQFRVVKTPWHEPNTAEVAVTNLAESTRAQLQSKGARVILEAGYAGSVERLFSGDARLITHTHSGADWTTKFQCGDGERAYRYARLSESFAAGTPLADVVLRLATAMGIDPGNAAAQIRGVRTQAVNGHACSGRAASELSRVLAAEGFAWSIQDGRLQVLRPGEAAKDLAVLLSADTGLVGSPEQGSPAERGKPAVLKIKALLQPRIRPGVRIDLRSRQFTGAYLAGKVEHAGDTAGGDWFSIIEATPI